MQLLACSVQLGASHASIVAWPELSVRGLVQRFLSICGLELDPDTVELHLDRYLLPPTSKLGSVIARWHRPVGGEDVIRLKAVIPRYLGGKARGKLDTRGPPLHTVRKVANRVMAAMAMQAGPSKWHSIYGSAADFSLLPYTFTNWTDAWDSCLMKVAVLLFRVLLPEKPTIAGAVLQACSDLLDLPSAFAPDGQLYQGLCILQLHISLLQAANEIKAATLTSRFTSSPLGPASSASGVTPAAAPGSDAAAAAAAAEASGCQTPQGANSSRAGRLARGGRSGSSSSTATSTGSKCAISSSTSSGSTSRAREARQRESALDALTQLLAKAAARVGNVLEQLSYYGSELSDMLDNYSPPEPRLVAGFEASSGGRIVREGAVAAATNGGGSCGAPLSPARDLRLQVAEVLEPYAAMQLLEAFGRMAMAGYPTAAPPPLLPPSTLPSGSDCHRSLFHTILELGAQAGIRVGVEGRSEGSGRAEVETGLRPTNEAAGTESTSLTLELPLVASMLDVLLQLHVQAHSQCPSGGKSAAMGATGEDSEDSSSDEGTRCCPRTPALCQLPPCLDWLQDVTSVLEAACDVYALVGNLEAEGEAETAEVQPTGAANAAAASRLPNAVMTAAAALPGTSGRILPIGAMASATMAAAVGAAATATVAAMESTRLGDTAGGAMVTATAAAVAAEEPEENTSMAPGWPAGDSGGRPGSSTDAPLPAGSSSPGPFAPRTPQPGSVAGSRGDGCSGDSGTLDSEREQAAGAGAGADHVHERVHAPRSCPLLPGDDGATEDLLPQKASNPTEMDAEEEAPPAPATPLPAASASAVTASAPQMAATLPIAAGSSALKLGVAVAPYGPSPAAALAEPAAAVGPVSFALPSARLMIVDALHRAFQCPCLVEQLLAEGPRAGELCERAVWRHPRLAGCAPAAAYYKQALDQLLKPLSYVYDEDDYDAPVVYVDRSDMLGTSFASLMDVEGFLDHEGICVKFEDEDAYGDGVLREWLTEIAASVFDPNAGLFRLCEGDVRALHLSPAGSQQDDQLELLRFAGRIIGLAMRARVPLGLHLSTALFKMLQHPGESGRSRLGMADLAELDPRLAATCSQIATTSDVEALGLTFVASCGHLGLAHEVPLLPGGAGEDVPVTAANLRDYLDRLVRFYCTWGCSSKHGKLLMDDGSGGQEKTGARDLDACALDAAAALAQGLAEALFRTPDSDEDDRVELLATRLRSISAAAFNSRLGGEVGGIDVEAWRSHTSAPAFKTDREREVLKAFWDVVSELSADEQRRLLQFWTGISHLPAGGFKHLSQQLQLVPARTGDECFGGGEAAREYHAAYTDLDMVITQLAEPQGGGHASASGDDASSRRGEPPHNPAATTLSESVEAGTSTSTSSESDTGTPSGIVPAMDNDQNRTRGSSGGGGSGSDDSSSNSSGTGSSSTRTYAESSNNSGGSSAGDVSASGSSTGGISLDADRGAAGSEATDGRGGGRGPGGRAIGPPTGPTLLAAHTCFFQLRLPLLKVKIAMREAVMESLANLGAFWNE